MWNRAAVVLTLTALLGSAARTTHAAACNGTPGPTKTIELQVSGVTRMFVLRAPAGYDARTPVPVVFAFHPFGMNVQYMQGRVPFPTAWPEAIAVYPQALPGAAGRSGFQPSWQSTGGEAGGRDLVFFDAMVEWLSANHCIDHKRVFVMGYSNGARFSGALACERAGVLAGVAMASGSLSCEPLQPLPIILSHGIRDSTIEYEQGVAASRRWAARNDCKAPPKNGVPGCFVADSCGAAPVVLCTYDGGHEYNEPFTRAVVEFFKAARKQ
jgi:polyhydroxybutyrate depolymerase